MTLYLGVYKGFQQEYHAIGYIIEDIHNTLEDYSGEGISIEDIDLYEITPIKVTMNKTYVIEPTSLASDIKE